MIIYFIKSTFLFLVFFLIYKGMLEKKKSSKFKRFYLIVATALSLVFPLINVHFSVKQNILTNAKQIIIEEIGHQEFIPQFVPDFSLPEVNQTPILLIIYFLISGILAFHFLWNIDKILVLKRKGIEIKNSFGILVLNDTVKSPFSFHNRIYLNKSQWNKEMIGVEILYHEQAHIQQKHTLDILFMEFLKVFLWFQPFLYLFKRLMQENHEYLADEYSLSKTRNVQQYQKLILSFYNQPSKELQLSSSFYFSNLKKRFIMMKNMKKGRVWESVFYSSAALIIYFGFVGIEAQAAEIKYVETKISEAIENAVKEPEKVLDEVISVVSETVTGEVLILKYVEGQKYSGSFSNSSDGQTYFYVVSSEKEVSIYNRYGVIQDNKEFSYKLEKIVEENRFKEELSQQLNTIEEQPKVYYKNNGFNTGKVTINDVWYSYVVDGDRNVVFYDDNGKRIEIEESEYSLMDADKRLDEMVTNSTAVISKGILNNEDYTKLAFPLLIDERKFQQGLMEVATKNLYDRFTEKAHFLVEFYFDIDEEGNVINVRESSNQPFPETEKVKKYLYSQQKWQPSEKDGEKVLSTYKFALEIFLKYTHKEYKEFKLK